MEPELLTVYLIIGIYLVVTLLSGFIFYKRAQASPEDYFLAGRGVGLVVLFFTLVATNFSAFFFLGFAGAGYRIGYSYYAMMSFGTALAGLSIYGIGHKAWQLGRSKGYITPPELIGDLSGSKGLKYLYLTVLVFFTLPYLALQPIGAGIILEQLTHGQIPYFMGASGLTAFIVIYVFLGGMRSVAITDLVQGIIMFVLILLAVWFIAGDLGGLAAANGKVYRIRPELFGRGGAGNYFSPEKWFSLMLLWLFCVPMFPHMFMRFFIGRDVRSLKVSTVLYALVPFFLFICPVTIGVLGHLTFPGLEGKAADQILPMMMNAHAPGWVGALIMVGALAAFMSTLDSQLLAVSTMITRDIYLPLSRKKVSFSQQILAGRIFVIVFAALGLVIAWSPPDTIFAIAKQTFTGYAVLFPATVSLLYFRQTNALACILSILAGEFILFGLYMKWIPEEWLGGFEPVIPVLLIASIFIVVGNRIHRKRF